MFHLKQSELKKVSKANNVFHNSGFYMTLNCHNTYFYINISVCDSLGLAKGSLRTLILLTKSSTNKVWSVDLDESCLGMGFG